MHSRALNAPKCRACRTLQRAVPVDAAQISIGTAACNTVGGLSRGQVVDIDVDALQRLSGCW
jgi:hypothetical protein